MYFFKAKFQSSQLQSFFWERHAEYIHVFKLKNNRLNNHDFNIDQNNRTLHTATQPLFSILPTLGASCEHFK
jgi:hypothetical protein